MILMIEAHLLGNAHPEMVRLGSPLLRAKAVRANPSNL